MPSVSVICHYHIKAPARSHPAWKAAGSEEQGWLLNPTQILKLFIKCASSKLCSLLLPASWAAQLQLLREACPPLLLPPGHSWLWWDQGVSADLGLTSTGGWEAPLFIGLLMPSSWCFQRLARGAEVPVSFLLWINIFTHFQVIPFPSSWQQMIVSFEWKSWN